jgi:hypothetical protein
MPAHIYIRVGRYHDASVANERAAAEKLAASLPPERYEEFPFLEEFVPVPLYA